MPISGRSMGFYIASASQVTETLFMVMSSATFFHCRLAVTMQVATIVHDFWKGQALLSHELPSEESLRSSIVKPD